MYRSIMGLKHLYCRVCQFIFNYGAKCLAWRKAVPVEGAGSAGRIPGLLREMGVQKPLVVTDPGLVRAGIAGTVTDILTGAGAAFALYGEVESNPSVQTVNAIRRLYLAEGCDGLIAVGGGSVMDAAKAAGARICFPRRTVNRMGGLFKVGRRLPPLIAVPTTAGTGSETTIAALITDTETRHKYAIMDLHLIPRYAVLDPELTAGLPPAITAATGMDALTHAVEAYLCWTYNTKESIRFALEAVRAIFENLERVYRNGRDLEARQAMLLASYKAGFAFTRAGVGNVHAIAHTLGGLYNTPHGLANAVILPVVLEEYGTRVHRKLARLAEAAGITGSGVHDGAVANGNAITDDDKARAFIAAIYAMNGRMGTPRGFDCIRDEDIPLMTKRADRESNPFYPVPVLFDRDRFRQVIEKIRIKR
jgi:alcohol dehydrogenase class IV